MRVFALFVPGLFLAFGLLLSGSAAAQSAPPFQWVTAGYSTTNQPLMGVNRTPTMAIDAAGNVYAGLSFAGKVQLGNQVFPAADSTIRTNLTKFGPLGNVVWVKEMPIVQGVGTDSAGNVFVAGEFDGLSAVVDGRTVTGYNASGPSYYLAKWSASGQLQWVVSGGCPAVGGANPGNASVFGMTMTHRGEPVVVGSYNGTLEAGTLTGAPNTFSSRPVSFCLRFSPANGAAQWLVTGRPTDATSVCLGERVAADRFGNVHCFGTYLDNVAFNGLQLPPAPRVIVGSRGYGRTFHVVIGPAGQPLRQFSYLQDTTGNLNYQQVTVDDEGYAYVTNTFKGGAYHLPDTTLQAVGPSYNTFVARYTPTGTLQWVKQLRTTVVHDFTEPWGIRATKKAGVLLTGMWRGLPTLDGQPLGYESSTGSRVGGISLFVLALDATTGRLQWLQQARSRNVTGGEVIDVNSQGEIAVLGGMNGDTARFGSTLVGQPTDPWSFPKTLVLKLQPRYNTLRGPVFLDANADNLLSPGESAFRPTAIVRLRQGVPAAYTDSLFVTTDAAGLYDAVVGQGTYTAEVVPPRYYQTTAAAPATFAGFGGLAVRPLPLRPQPGRQDLRVTLTPITRARPGFPVKYHVTYRNVGTVAVSGGSITLVPDGRLAYLSNTGGGTFGSGQLTVNFGALAPAQGRSFEVLFQLGTSARLGDTLVTRGALTPTMNDLMPADNAETSRLLITGSYDPNNISVNWPVLTPQQVSAGEWLEYVIRFQNLGTDTAFTVALRDSLPRHLLNLGTLELLAASDTCDWTLRPDGVLLVRFANVRLPHAGINTVGSLGFVRFRVRPRATLAVGDLIPNRAGIYFDFSPPIQTNTATTEINQTNGLPGTTEPLPCAVWPNPTHGTLYVETTLAAPGPLTLRLLDATGRTVATEQAPSAAGAVRQTLDLRALPAGLYLLRVEAAGRAFTRRVLVR